MDRRRTLPAWLYVAACSTTPTASTTPTTVASAPATEAAQTRPIAVDVEGDIAVLPTALTSFGAATHGHHLYVLGGYSGTPHAYSQEGQHDALLRLDLQAHTWTRVGSIAPAQSIALVDAGDFLVRVGGMRALNEPDHEADLQSVATVARFDPVALAWQPLPDLPQPRSSHDAIVVGRDLFVAGGWTLDGGETTWSGTVLRMNLDEGDDAWHEIDAPFRRRALATAAAGDKLVVIGGITPDRDVSSRVDVYDPQNDTWSQGPDFPSKAFGVAAVGVGDDVVASAEDGVVRRWKVGTDHWVDIDTLTYPRFFHRLVAASDRQILAVGGIRGMDPALRVRPVESIDLRPSNEARVTHIQLPSQLPTKNRQGLFLYNDVLYAFGGNKSLGQHDFGPEFFSDAGRALNLATLQWSAVAPYPRERQSMSTLEVDGRLVAVGGFGHDGEVARSHPEIFAYDPVRDRWTEIGSMPKKGRTQFGLVEHEATLWVFGGLDYDPRRPKGDQFRHEQALLNAPLEGEEIAFAPAKIELRGQRRAFAGASLGDRYVLVGGMRDGFQLVDTCEAFRFATREWSDFACPSRVRLSAEMVEIEDKLYLAGGSSRASEDAELAPDRSIEVYDPETGDWSTLIDELPIDTKHMRMFAYRDRLLLFNAHDEADVVHLVIVKPPRGKAPS